MFDKMKQMYDLQKKAKEMQKAMEEMTVERTSAGGKVSVVLNGNFKVEKVSIDESALTPGNKAALEKTLAELFSSAAEDVRAQSAQRAMGMMKGMNLKVPGM